MDKIGRYRLTQRIGAGSFATVWKGHDDELDAAVAIKILADNWADNDDVRNRFLTEARLLRKLQDERIVRVYDIGTLPDGRPYFVMDYCNGGSLDLLRKHPAEPGRVLRLCAEAARALEVLHRHNIIHRDVTPGNILLTQSETGQIRVLLADLGVAKSMADHAGATMTAGTPAYMALEQANGAPFDQRVDIYSIAAVTYALLSGRPPFPVKSLADLLSRNPNVTPAPIADQVGAPPALDALLFAALSPNPNQRPQTAEIMASALDRFADVLPGGQTFSPRPLPANDGPSQIRPATPGYATTGSYATGFPAPMAHSEYPMVDSSYGSGYGSVTGGHSMGTPHSVLDSYGPGGSYYPVQPEKRHSALFYVWVALSGVALFFAAMLVTMLLTG